MSTEDLEGTGGAQDGDASSGGSAADSVKEAGKRVLVPLAAGAATAAAAFVAKRAPDFLREKVLPKLKESEGPARDAVERVREAISSIPSPGGGSNGGDGEEDGDVETAAGEDGSAARSGEAGDEASQSEEGAGGDAGDDAPARDREAERRQRAERRQARRKQASK